MKKQDGSYAEYAEEHIRLRNELEDLTRDYFLPFYKNETDESHDLRIASTKKKIKKVLLDITVLKSEYRGAAWLKE